MRISSDCAFPSGDVKTQAHKTGMTRLCLNTRVADRSAINSLEKRWDPGAIHDQNQTANRLKEIDLVQSQGIAKVDKNKNRSGDGR